MNLSLLRDEFKAAWRLANDDSSVALTDSSRLPHEIALDMIESRVTYWEHYGWVSVCLTALNRFMIQGGEGTKVLVAEHSQWLLHEAPEGVADLYPTLNEYAFGKAVNTDLTSPIIKGHMDEGITRLTERKRLTATA